MPSVKVIPTTCFIPLLETCACGVVSGETVSLSCSSRSSFYACFTAVGFYVVELHPAEAHSGDPTYSIVELQSATLSPTRATTDIRLTEYACMFVKTYVHFVQSVFVRHNAASVFIHIRT